MNRAQDWFEQAKRDLLHAKHSLEAKDYEWSCFSAQQSAEKALKALYMKLNMIVWGHSILELIENLPEKIKVSEELRSAGKILDKFYIPPRYPNAHPSGAPYKFYTENDAKEAILRAQEVIDFCASYGFKD